MNITYCSCQCHQSTCPPLAGSHCNLCFPGYGQQASGYQLTPPMMTVQQHDCAAAIREAVAAERERCAKIAEEWGCKLPETDVRNHSGKEIASRIRR